MTIKISGKWCIVGLFLILETALVWLYHFHNDHDRATIAFIATVLGGGFALYTYLQGLDERRSLTAHSYIERWNETGMLEIRLVLLDIMEHQLDPSTLSRDSLPLRGKRLSVVTVLNFFEEIAIAVSKRTANEERLKDFFAAIVQQSFAKLEEWIKRERQLDNEPNYYSEFERLAGSWKSKK